MGLSPAHRADAPSIALEGLLGLVLCATVLQSIVLWDVRAGSDALGVALRTWHFLVILAETLFALVALAHPACRRALSALTRLQAGLLLALTCYVAWRSLSAPHVGSIAFGIWWLVQIAFFVGLLGAVRGGVVRLGGIWFVVAGVAVVQVGILLVAFAAEPWAEGQMPGWAHPGYSNYRHPGYLIAAAGAAMAACFLQRRRWAAVALMMFTVVAFHIALTGARGAFIALGVGVATALVAIRASGQRALWGRLAILVLVTAAMIVLSEAAMSEGFTTLVERAMGTARPGADVTAKRLDLWLGTLDVIEGNWAFGSGPTVMRLMGIEWVQGRYNQPHNVILQVLLHWGVVGSALLVGVAAAFLAPVKMAAVARRAAAGLAAAVCLSVHALVDGALFYPFTVLVFLVAFIDVICAGGARQPDEGAGT